MRDQPEETVTWFQRLLDLRPGVADTQFDLGHAHEKSGSLAKAADHYRQALALNIQWAVERTDALNRSS